MDVEVEIGEERADGDGHRRGEQHHRRDQEHHRQQVLVQGDGEEGRRLLDVRRRVKQPAEQDEVSVQKEEEDEGDEQRAQGRPSGRGGANDPDVPQGRPFVPLPEREKAAPGEEGFQPPEDAAYNFEPYMPRPEDRPKVLVTFHDKADQLLMSGMLEGGDELAGKPAVVLAPRGRGNVLLFAVNPMWRMNTQGMYPLVMNAVINWDKLR